MSWVSALIVIDQEERSHYQHCWQWSSGWPRHKDDDCRDHVDGGHHQHHWHDPVQQWDQFRVCCHPWAVISVRAWSLHSTNVAENCKLLQVSNTSWSDPPSPQQQVNKNNPTFYADQGGDARRCRQCYEHVLSVTLWTVDTKDTHLTPPLDSVLPLSFYKWPRAEDIRSINSQDWSMAGGSVSIYYDNSLIKLLCLELWVQ